MNAKEIMNALAADFPAGEVKMKPKIVKDSRCLVIHYIDARAVQDRLDAVLGVDGWQDEYQVLGDGSVQCQLRLRIGAEWIAKSDVGSQSDQDDGGDRLKAAFSDALKRAAVKFGVGRFLYAKPATWMDYDPVKKRIVEKPAAPASPPASAAPPAKTNGHANGNGNGNGRALPATGKDFFRRLDELDEPMAKEGRCRRRQLLNFVRQRGKAAGFTQVLAEWPAEAIKLAVDFVKAFETTCPAEPVV